LGLEHWCPSDYIQCAVKLFSLFSIEAGKYHVFPRLDDFSVSNDPAVGLL
jgi:hypothetical protein